MTTIPSNIFSKKIHFTALKRHFGKISRRFRPFLRRFDLSGRACLPALRIYFRHTLPWLRAYGAVK